MTEKRFINDIDIGQLIDTKGELSTIDYSDKVDFYELWEFLNKLNDENEQLKKDVEYWKQVASQYSNELNVFEHCKKYKTECKDIHWSSDGMTEKRFDVYYDEYMENWKVQDNITLQIIPCISESVAKELGKKLNEQHETIQRLKQNIDDGLW